MIETVFKVEGTMCNGCENRVQNSLKNIEGVENVVADHTNKTVKITSSKNISDQEVESIIQDLGYEVIEREN